MMTYKRKYRKILDSFLQVLSTQIIIIIVRRIDSKLRHYPNKVRALYCLPWGYVLFKI